MNKPQLAFCKVCNNQKFDPNQGIICKLTDAPAAFESTCDSYEQNDFLVKKEIETKSKNDLDSRMASSGKRFTNYFIDYLVLIIINLNIGIFLGVFMAALSPDSLQYVQNAGIIEQYVFATIVGTIYYTFFEAISGRSIGKLITKTKVVDQFGNKPSFSALLLRSICRFIPFEAFSFLGGSEPRGWHDTISNTKVINIK